MQEDDCLKVGARVKSRNQRGMKRIIKFKEGYDKSKLILVRAIRAF